MFSRSSFAALLLRTAAVAGLSAVGFGGGCASSPPEYASEFTFSPGTQAGEWKPTRFNLLQIARDYVRDKGIQFDVDSARPHLVMGAEKGVVTATVMFLTKPGDLFLTVVIATDGKVVRHSLDVDRS